MAISPERIRELAARGESALLDFKEADYDWANRNKNPTKNPANTELAKDLMAMANVLRVGSEPAYILIGVKDDGEIVGVPSGEHVDDADLHEKVKNLLTPTVVFSYASVDVDGASVGVYEVRGGKRPHFPLKDAGAIQRHVARYRSGSSTDIASPTMILEWAREDDPDGYRLRSLELRRAEAEALVRGKLYSVGSNSSNDVTIKLEVENIGRSGFEVDRCDWRVEWNEQFYEHAAKHSVTMPDGYEAPHGTFLISSNGTYLSPGQRIGATFVWTRLAACEHLGTIGIPGHSGTWATYHFSAPCRGELGVDGVLVGAVRL